MCQLENNKDILTNVISDVNKQIHKEIFDVTNDFKSVSKTRKNVGLISFLFVDQT